MAQFTVYKNSNPQTKKMYPLLLDVQSDLLEDLQTRVVIPLSKSTHIKKPMNRLMPTVQFEDQKFVLFTPQLAGVASSELGAAVGSLSDKRDLILAATDFLLTGF